MNGDVSPEIRRLFSGSAEENFLQLAMKYFDRNFGTLPKAEIDQMMFEFAYSAMKDDSTDENDVPPLRVALQLGISPRRVEAFLERMVLRTAQYSEDGWKDTVINLLKTRKPRIVGETVFYTLPSIYELLKLTNILDRKGYSYGITGSKGISISCEDFSELYSEAILGSNLNGIKEDDIEGIYQALLNSGIDEDRAQNTILEIKNILTSNQNGDSYQIAKAIGKLIWAVIGSANTLFAFFKNLSSLIPGLPFLGF